MIIIPDHLPNPYYPYTTMGDDSRPSQLPLRTSTESDDLIDGKTLFYHNLDSLLGGTESELDDEHPPHPFPFLDLPLEIQLEVVDLLSESYDLDAPMHSRRHPLLDLRQ